DGNTSVIKVGTGTWTLTGQNTYTGSTIVSNGVLALAPGTGGGGSNSNSTNIYIAPRAGPHATPPRGQNPVVGHRPKIIGHGTVRGLLSVPSGSTVAPGASVGTLTVTNNVTLGGTAFMELDRSLSPNSDRLVAPAINYNSGTLVVTNIGSTLHVGDTFTLFSG